MKIKIILNLLGLSTSAAVFGPASAWAADDDADDDLIVDVEGEQDPHARRTTPEAVSVVDITAARREGADLGEVLARSEGMTIQRTGGLGSAQRVTLDGLRDDQVRVFLDGVPLERTGLGTTLADIPLDLVERVEVHHGVVPIRLGADALGGAIEVISPEPREGVHGRAALQAGSWGTLRASGEVRARTRTGLTVLGGAFHDQADNDWPIDVQVADLSGALADVTLRRKNAAYRGSGARLGLRADGVRWADRASLTLMASDTWKEVPHNQVMTVPYGEVAYGRQALGATGRWARFIGDVHVDAVAAVSLRRTRLLDTADVVYDWEGEVIRERQTPGELDGEPHDRVTDQRSVYVRTALSWQAHPRHRVDLVLAPVHDHRTGDEREQREGDRDPLEVDQDRAQLVSGLSWTADVGERTQVVSFAKMYAYKADLYGTTAFDYEPRRITQDHLSGGAGAALRVRLGDRLFAKGSFERATRLPGPDEVFGDGVLVQSNLELRPETSVNGNVGLQWVAADTPIGGVDLSTRALVRRSDDLIVLMSQDITQQWENVARAQALGVQGAASWTEPSDHLHLSGALTWLDLRNTAKEGTFALYAGDRVPNVPWLTGAGRVRLSATPSPAWLDRLSATWSVRHVHRYFRSWESAGATSSKQVIPPQTVQSVGVSATILPRAEHEITATAELFNLLDANTYDVFGVQRPGRTLSFRLSTAW